MVPSRIRVLMVGVRNMNGSVEWACPWRSKGRALTLWAEPAGHPSAAKPTLDSSLGRTGGGRCFTTFPAARRPHPLVQRPRCSRYAFRPLVYDALDLHVLLSNAAAIKPFAATTEVDPAMNLERWCVKTEHQPRPPEGHN